MRPETDAKYRAATERKYSRSFTDREWEEIKARYIQKRRCRYAVAKNLERGVIEAYCCEKCGSEESEAHHPNYRYPLAVVWLCRKHHKRLHVEISKAVFFERWAIESEWLDHAQKRGGKPAHWSIEEALRGYEITEEEEWGSIEDFQDTLIDYDQEEVARSNADSEDCPPQFIHATEAEDLPPAANSAESLATPAPQETESGESRAEKKCPHCGGILE